MKYVYGLLAFIGLPLFSHAQNVGIGTTTPRSSAALEIVATNKALLLPRVTDYQMWNLPNPAPGMLVYNTEQNRFFGYKRGGITGSISQFSGASLVDAAADGPWQSFSAAATGFLSTISLYGFTTAPTRGGYYTLTMTIYAGEGTGGTVLGSMTDEIFIAQGTVGQTSASDITFHLATPYIPVTSGQVYTFQISRGTLPSLKLLYDNANPYANGKMGPTTIPGNNDLQFLMHLSTAGAWAPLD